MESTPKGLNELLSNLELDNHFPKDITTEILGQDYCGPNLIMATTKFVYVKRRDLPTLVLGKIGADYVLRIDINSGESHKYEGISDQLLFIILKELIANDLHGLFTKKLLAQLNLNIEPSKSGYELVQREFANRSRNILNMARENFYKALETLNIPQSVADLLNITDTRNIKLICGSADVMPVYILTDSQPDIEKLEKSESFRVYTLNKGDVLAIRLDIGVVKDVWWYQSEINNGYKAPQRHRGKNTSTDRALFLDEVVDQFLSANDGNHGTRYFLTANDLPEGTDLNGLNFAASSSNITLRSSFLGQNPSTETAYSFDKIPVGSTVLVRGTIWPKEFGLPSPPVAIVIPPKK